MNLRTIAALAAATLTTLTLGTTPALASDPLQTQIDAIIAQYGGEQIAPNQVSWESGEAVLTIPTGVTTFAVGPCATGKFCAYNSPNQLGTSLSFTNCTATNSTAPLGVVRSVANARSSGTVTAYNGGTAVLTVAAGKSVNTGATITRLGC